MKAFLIKKYQKSQSKEVPKEIIKIFEKLLRIEEESKRIL